MKTRITDYIELDIGFNEPLNILYRAELEHAPTGRPRTADEVKQIRFFLQNPDNSTTLYPVDKILPPDAIDYLLSVVFAELYSSGLIHSIED